MKIGTGENLRAKGPQMCLYVFILSFSMNHRSIPNFGLLRTCDVNRRNECGISSDVTVSGLWFHFDIIEKKQSVIPSSNQ